MRSPPPPTLAAPERSQSPPTSEPLGRSGPSASRWGRFTSPAMRPGTSGRPLRRWGGDPCPKQPIGGDPASAKPGKPTGRSGDRPERPKARGITSDYRITAVRLPKTPQFAVFWRDRTLRLAKGEKARIHCVLLGKREFLQAVWDRLRSRRLQVRILSGVLSKT